ncbi:MAG: hypothetical protein M3R30_09235 [Candidatus Eremiobacteraeota bacterium]|nr:hypothetical protein [Candidatus Eremiobacteraeota bacterium]
MRGALSHVDRVAASLREIGAEKIGGPEKAYGPDYHAVFFADPDGGRLEVCHVTRP